MALFPAAVQAEEQNVSVEMGGAGNSISSALEMDALLSNSGLTEFFSLPQQEDENVSLVNATEVTDTTMNLYDVYQGLQRQGTYEDLSYGKSHDSKTGGKRESVMIGGMGLIHLDTNPAGEKVLNTNLSDADLKKVLDAGAVMIARAGHKPLSP